MLEIERKGKKCIRDSQSLVKMITPESDYVSTKGTNLVTKG